jgi:hypothetical protein
MIGKRSQADSFRTGSAKSFSEISKGSFQDNISNKHAFVKEMDAIAVRQAEPNTKSFF